jgi:hypothetical protein
MSLTCPCENCELNTICEDGCFDQWKWIKQEVKAGRMFYCEHLDDYTDDCPDCKTAKGVC